MVSVQARPAAIEIDPAKTALVIVDMQNAFASMGGMFDLAGFDISGAPAVTRPINGWSKAAAPPASRWSICKSSMMRICGTRAGRPRPTTIKNWAW